MVDKSVFEQVLSAIAAHARVLRDSGVVGRVTIGDVCFELAAAEHAAITTAGSSQLLATNTVQSDPMNDEDTFGGYMPRRRRAVEQSDSDELE